MNVSFRLPFRAFAAQIIVFALLLMPTAMAQEPAVASPTDLETEEAAVSEATTTTASTPGDPTTTGARPPPPRKRWNPRKDKSTPKYLGLAALLLLWLLARSEERRKVATRVHRPNRRTPISPNELGHAAVHAALEADIEEFRGLFLSGPEAAQVLGTERAAAYLDRRSLSFLEDALADLAARIPEGAHFRGGPL